MATVFPAREGRVAVPGGTIWYEVVGEAATTPLLTVHGGPGGTHDYLEPLAALAAERPVIFYDQLGAGKSDHPDDLRLWHNDRFVAELAALIDDLNYPRIHLLGQSWGTIFATEYALAHPERLRSLVLANPALSVPRYVAAAAALHAELPADIQATLNRHEAAGPTDAEEYQTAGMAFYQRHVCRLDPWPDALMRSFAQLNQTIYETMSGPSEFSITGIHKDYDITDRLPELRLPTLFLCGRYDETRPEDTAWYASVDQQLRLHVFHQAAETGHVPKPDEMAVGLGQPQLEVEESLYRLLAVVVPHRAAQRSRTRRCPRLGDARRPRRRGRRHRHAGVGRAAAPVGTGHIRPDDLRPVLDLLARAARRGTETDPPLSRLVLGLVRVLGVGLRACGDAEGQPEDAGIRAYVPLPDMNHRRPFYGQDEFTYDAAHDAYSCPAGHVLGRERIKHTEGVIVYRADAATCHACPLKAECTESRRGRIVHRSLYAEYLDKVRADHATEAYKNAMRKRQVWVEPLFAEAKLWHGLRRFRRRGLVNVNIEGLLIAAGQNLKRFLAARGWGRCHAPCGSLVAFPREPRWLVAAFR
jgi:proline iminopeptidase